MPERSVADSPRLSHAHSAHGRTHGHADHKARHKPDHRPPQIFLRDDSFATAAAFSLLRLSALTRLAGAGLLSALIWMGVWWALH